ncbi:GNAT family N-acetyltransferase [Paenibacillus polymyxa]|jgi:RimJ/RimL family protein N-acetyltransferase|uniref:GNAT family N-acetyltransferase n=1 Tax=Paenibacillus polymyxa TaxID=1406 RepID=UPI0005CE69FE|nr:GNAT family protein [Paenibacillus polymyxa]KJD39257.1 acetyltransferase [Paenibacillus polymyxa]MBY0022153.1 GNAT family N-acetyltransferase [Paenibacillus polymyxa]MBY0057996.1 GNAT family N-acetyltransferase [Paenibacillus polymyxa]MBY0068609.1 GNAT family N-acetyltransferase [Paenibacillus polymyxa]MBY0079176.1 GNAT family N-acetyltransferase [Paenibacillus polymyxa]
MLTENYSSATPVARLLEGSRVYLRPINVEDTELYYNTLFHQEVRRLTGTQRSFTKEQIARYIEAKGQDSSSLLLLIALQEDDRVIGDIALQDMDSLNRSANIRIAINEQGNQGKGYGTEALVLMLGYGFGICNLHRIELNVFDFNEQAIRCYEKVGFQREGVQRDALFYNYEYHDSILMSMLQHEYCARYVEKAKS